MLFPQYETRDSGTLYIIYISEGGTYYQVTIPPLFTDVQGTIKLQ